MLPASKSMSNRALVINEFCSVPTQLKNLSEARDTKTMIALLKSDANTWDVKDAGTTMRFLTAFATVTHKLKTITGTVRMQQRPIRVLVNALRDIGAKIEFLENDGFPPIQIKSFEQKTNTLSIRGDVSSQYISALLMIAPALPLGLKLQLEGKIGSRPYIKMTLDIMQHFGVDHSWNDNIITITPQKYIPTPFIIEPDWSAASYWYSFVALSKNSKVLLKNSTKYSFQGDSVLCQFMSELGVDTKFTDEGAWLTKTKHKNTFNYDFSDTPDLAQTIAVICAVKGIKGQFKGLESLRIKETNRIQALQNELAKIGASLIERDNMWQLNPSNLLPDAAIFNTYEDHRMAMSFAPLCLLMDITFEDKSVVNKSYPQFWIDLHHAIK